MQTAFGWPEQAAFAALSGDCNPMHMDRVAARRTPAGACVVHGMQSALWALDRLAAGFPATPAAIAVDLAQFLYVDETVSLRLLRQDAAELRAELRTGGTRVAQITVRFDARPAPEAASEAVAVAEAGGAGPLHDPAAPCDPSWAEIETAHGAVPLRPDTGPYAALRVAIGAARIAAMLAMTRLVGMVTPGLHSVFHRFSLRLHAGEAEAGPLWFRTVRSDARFGMVTVGLRGPGLSGSLVASRRAAPSVQPPAAALRGLASPGQFAGHAALVIGGSRGLGEVAGKLLALGGARTAITFHTGEQDARAVAADLAQAGAAAETLPFDADAAVAEQVRALPFRPLSVYYFATPRIAARRQAGFSSERFAGFCRTYVQAFAELCEALADAAAPVGVFYPSSVFVERPPEGMVEYAMAKAAGETLCEALERSLPGLRIACCRLPRLPTDQSAGLLAPPTGDAVDTLWPIIRQVEARVAARLGNTAL